MGIAISQREATLQICRSSEGWIGSFYELVLEYPPLSLSSRERGNLARAIWAAPELEGVVGEREAFGQRWHDVSTLAMESGQHHLGLMRLAPDRVIGCSGGFIEITDLLQYVLCIPTFQLELHYPVAYPIDPNNSAANPWMRYVNNVFANIARRAFDAMPFRLGSMGEEASAFDWFTRLTPSQLEKKSDLLVPIATFDQFAVTPHGVEISSDLYWTAPVDSSSGQMEQRRPGDPSNSPYPESALTREEWEAAHDVTNVRQATSRRLPTQPILDALRSPDGLRAWLQTKSPEAIVDDFVLADQSVLANFLWERLGTYVMTFQRTALLFDVNRTEVALPRWCHELENILDDVFVEERFRDLRFHLKSTGADVLAILGMVEQGLNRSQ
jgi:hypothetical protein